MRELKSGTLTVLAYDYNVYMQEHNTLTITDTQADKVTIAFGNVSNVLAVYTLDDAHECVVDWSDFLRSYGAGDVYIYTSHSKVVNANFQVVGLIDPHNLVIPATDGGALIEPPSMILRQAFAGEGNSIVFNVFANKTDSITIEWRTTDEGGGEYDLRADEGTEIAVENLDEIQLGTATGTTYITAKELDPCKRYAMVRWMSATGMPRAHTFEVRDLEIAAGDVVKLETVNGQYKQAKGRNEGLKLYLENLTAYDYWYYADLITSSRVEVSLDGVTYYEVEVTTKSVTIPNCSEGALNKLEVELNWRKYDEIIM